LDGTAIDGEFSTRRVLAFVPKVGSKLEEVQGVWEERNQAEEGRETEDQAEEPTARTEVDAWRHRFSRKRSME
jgi:hypothetical protein